MILPSKYIPKEKALLTVGADLLKNLNKPKTVSAMWEEVRQCTIEVQSDATYLSYDWFILSLDLLYAIDAIEIHEGLLKRRKSS